MDRFLVALAPVDSSAVGLVPTTSALPRRRARNDSEDPPRRGRRPPGEGGHTTGGPPQRLIPATPQTQHSQRRDRQKGLQLCYLFADRAPSAFLLDRTGMTFEFESATFVQGIDVPHPHGTAPPPLPSENNGRVPQIAQTTPTGALTRGCSCGRWWWWGGGGIVPLRCLKLQTVALSLSPRQQKCAGARAGDGYLERRRAEVRAKSSSSVTPCSRLSSPGFIHVNMGHGGGPGERRTPRKPKRTAPDGTKADANLPPAPMSSARAMILTSGRGGGGGRDMPREAPTTCSVISLSVETFV